MTMATEQECVCCQESYIIQPHRGSESCITTVGLFKELVLNEDGLKYSRYLYSLTIEDEQKRAGYMRTELNAPKLRFLAYKSFINILSSTEFDRKIRYVLPACIVRAVRDQFPNPDGVPYKGYAVIKSSDGQQLP